MRWEQSVASIAPSELSNNFAVHNNDYSSAPSFYVMATILVDDIENKTDTSQKGSISFHFS